MPEVLCLVDSNILIRWVQPHDPDYAAVTAAVTRLAELGNALCYTSQNLGEFWNALTRPVMRNGYGLTPQQADRRARSFESRLRLRSGGSRGVAQIAGRLRSLGRSGTRCAAGRSDARAWGRTDSDLQYQGFRAVHRDRSHSSTGSSEAMKTAQRPKSATLRGAS